MCFKDGYDLFRSFTMRETSNMFTIKIVLRGLKFAFLVNYGLKKNCLLNTFIKSRTIKRLVYPKRRVMNDSHVQLLQISAIRFTKTVL